MDRNNLDDTVSFEQYITEISSSLPERRSENNIINTQSELDRLSCDDDINEIYDSNYKYPRMLIDKHSSINIPLKTYILNDEQKIKLIIKFAVIMEIYPYIKAKYIHILLSTGAIKFIIEEIKDKLLSSEQNIILNHIKSSKHNLSKYNNNRAINIIKEYNNIQIVVELLYGKPYQSYNLNLELNTIISDFNMMMIKYSTLDDIEIMNNMFLVYTSNLLTTYYSAVYKSTTFLMIQIEKLFDFISNSLKVYDIDYSDETNFAIYKICEICLQLKDKYINMEKDLDKSIMSIIEIYHELNVIILNIYTYKVYIYPSLKNAINKSINIIDYTELLIDNLYMDFPEELTTYTQNYTGTNIYIKKMIEEEISIYGIIEILKDNIEGLLIKLINDHEMLA